MQSQITLESLKPVKTTGRKTATFILALITLVILVSSYRFVGMDPFKLIEKKDNAVTYLFGRTLTEFDRKDAMSQAEGMLRTITLEETRHDLVIKYRNSDRKPSGMEIFKEAGKIVDRELAAKPESYKQEFIRNQYKRILSEKKGGFFPPETGVSNLKEYSMGLVETIAMAIWGTLIAVVLSIPAAVLAAENTLALLVQGENYHHRAIRRFANFVVRRFLDFCRGFNEFVMALIFVAVIGLGPFAGVLALAVHTFGILGKVISEAIEAIEPGQMEAVVASGAGNTQVISFSVLPQVMPLIVSYSLLRFESNVRSATILGFCGAGGIGFLMFDKINGFEYHEVATMMIMVIAGVGILDFACGKLRSRFI